VARYTFHKLAPLTRFDAELATPSSFIEHIAVGNLGKFAIDSGSTNCDYAGKPIYLADSIDYVIADIEILAPDCVILPRTILENVNNTPEWRRRFPYEAPARPPCFAPIYQTNAGVINRHIKNRGKATGLVAEESLPPCLSDWMGRIDIRIDMQAYLQWLAAEFRELRFPGV